MFCIKTCSGTDVCGRFSDIRLVESVGRFSRLHIDSLDQPIMVKMSFEDITAMIKKYKTNDSVLPMAKLSVV